MLNNPVFNVIEDCFGLYQEPLGTRCQINSTVWTFPFTGVGGVTNMI
jgi:hypothetical protein